MRYPTEEELDFLAEYTYSAKWDGVAEKITDLVNEIGGGKATLEDDRLELVTGGWSGTETIEHIVRHSMWGMLFWYSSHRGGLHIYKRRPYAELE